MEIKLSSGHIVLVDKEDYDLISEHRWYLSNIRLKIPYAVTGNLKRYNGKRLRMHRLIMNAGPNQFIDHVNRNGLDNRRCNLRFCTRAQNNQNSYIPKGVSKFKGVSWAKSRTIWEARIGVNHRLIFIGYFENEIEAAEAYDKAALKHFGEFARINFPKEPTK